MTINHQKTIITTQAGLQVEAQAPVIISASRSTDIPAFYADWFIDRLQQGYVKWKNPFNGAPIYVSFQQTRLLVFWSKNPKPMLKHLKYLDEHNLNYYFLYTLNDYEQEGIERGVPKLADRIETFQKLASEIGKEKVIWRFDPLILTDTLGVDELLRRIEDIGNQLKGFTDKLVFSFAYIQKYKKVKFNLQKSSINYRDFEEKEIYSLASELQKLNQSLNFEICTCAEQIPFEQYNIFHNKCIDDDLIIKLFPQDNNLMDFLGVKVHPSNLFNVVPVIEKTFLNRDTGQRDFCGCVKSKDIGEYNTCIHQCEYCYANTSKQKAKDNFIQHLKNASAETITGK